MRKKNKPVISKKTGQSGFKFKNYMWLGVIFFICQSRLLVADEFYTFGIVPQHSASKIFRLWTPLLEYLSGKTGYKLRVTTAKNIPVFESRLRAGNYDFSYMNPYHYVVFQKSPGYKAFAKASKKKIRGIIVVHKDSAYEKLSDLNNNKLAFPSPLAFAASILTRGQLSKRGVVFTPVYVSSHDSVYRNVANKNFIAGGGVIRTFKFVDKKVREQLRILYTTVGYTPHAFAVHPRVPENVVVDILNAMIAMENTEQGIKLLKVLKINGLSAATNKDWDDVRKLGIQ